MEPEAELTLEQKGIRLGNALRKLEYPQPLHIISLEARLPMAETLRLLRMLVEEGQVEAFVMTTGAWRGCMGWRPRRPFLEEG